MASLLEDSIKNVSAFQVRANANPLPCGGLTTGAGGVMMSPMGSRLLLTALVLVLAPAGALADVYKWTDARGVIVLSSVPPEETDAASNVEVVAKEKRAAAKKTAAVEYQTQTSEQVLLDRIDSLERELRAQQQYSREAAVAPVTYPQGYYTTPQLPPPSYYPDPYYAPPYYPGAYGYPYATFLPPVTSVFLRSRGHFRHKHFPHAAPHGTFPRTIAGTGFARTAGTFRGGRR
jgi:hypothetical protein